MRSDFCAFILTHGRPNKVYTYKTLKRQGYTGRIVIVIDTEDKHAEEYKKIYKGEVVVFDKKKSAESFDEGDNFGDRRAIIYARNECFKIAKRLGVKYFIELDDDYMYFAHRFDENHNFVSGFKVENLDKMFSAMLKYFISIPALSIAFAQTGDFIGGDNGWARSGRTRKCMNSFFCSVDRPFQFVGRVNEDVNTYTHLASKGGLFFTIPMVALLQKQTQANSGGMTEMYLDSGTYVKSFYSVMFQPSSVKVGVIHSGHPRLHHIVSWDYTTPMIIRESCKKGKVANGR